MSVVLVLIHLLECDDHDGYCSCPAELETTYETRKQILPLPADFSESEYYDRYRFCEDYRVEIDLSDERLEPYEGHYNKMSCCESSKTRSTIVKAFLIERY